MQQLFTNPENLRKDAARLQAAASKLLEAASILEGNSALVSSSSESDDMSLAQQVIMRFTPPSQSKGRLETLRIFLNEHGPSTRKEILRGTKFPAGTISTLLGNKEIFLRTEDGKWSLKE